jgi:hypothetical protein
MFLVDHVNPRPERRGMKKEFQNMALPAEVARLVEMFERNREDYLHGRYSETQLRREYIDPLFKALG